MFDWTDEQNASLLDLRNVQRKKWSDIGIDMGRSKTACRTHYGRITNPNQRVKLFRHTWTPQDEAQLRQLRYVECKTSREVALIMGRSFEATQAKLERMKTPTQRLHFEKTTVKFIVPEHCLEDRARRLATAPRDLTAAFFGDPLPGNSALERRT